MTDTVWIQLIIMIGGAVAAMFMTIRYTIKETNKGKDSFLTYLEKMQNQQLEYYETKNGHLERISKAFSNAITKNTKAIDILSKELQNNKKK